MAVMRTDSSVLLPRLLLGVLLAVSAPVRAQDNEKPPGPAPAPATGFETQGTVGVGYRFTDVSGQDHRYRELFNLDDGLRLTDFTFFGRAASGQHLFADTFSMSASGLGGDPYQAIQLTARRNSLYDLRASFRQSNFFWDRSDTGYTNNHAWNTRRKLGTVSFLLHATSNLRLAFDFSHSGRNGMNLTTRTVDYFGSPAAWGSFARANAYTMLAPLDETTNRYAGGIDYSRHGWNAHYRTGYQIFDDTVIANAASGVSIDVADPLSRGETLENGSYQDYRRLTTPISEFSYDGRLTPALEWRGGYTFYRYSGPSGLQAAYSGLARSGSTLVPYDLSLDTRANVSEPTHVLDQGVTWDASGWVSVLVDYRYQQTGIDSTSHFTTNFNSSPGAGEATNRWRQKRNQVDVDFQFVPRADLLVSAGVRYLRNDIKVSEDGTADPYATRRVRTVWPTFRVSWKPSPMVDVRADIDSISNDVSYTRLTPETNVGSRILVTVRPTDQLSIVDAVNVRHQSLDAADYTANIRSNAVTANYQYTDNVAVFGGYSYDGLDATAAASFLRGTPPLDVTLRDTTVNHVWQAGFSWSPLPRLDVTFAGNYIRTTGLGSITGETPLYGPITYPYGTGTVSYDFPSVGRLSVDVTRTYYIEELNTLDNFGARIVMIRWTRKL
jgi:hypothetical protein